MSTGKKIKDLCLAKGIKVGKMEQDLSFSPGSTFKHDPNNMQGDRIRKIANYFNVTPTYLQSDMLYVVCPICGNGYNPLDDETILVHDILHENYVKLRDKLGFLLNPTQSATKRAVAEAALKNPNIPDEGKVFHYETIIQSDFADYACSNNYIVDISYNDFFKTAIREKKYFDITPPAVIKNLLLKYDVNLNDDTTPLIDLFPKDKTFMANVSDLWDLPEDLRHDVYKAIRHAKRDYADREYYTNPYANTSIRT